MNRFSLIALVVQLFFSFSSWGQAMARGELQEKICRVETKGVIRFEISDLVSEYIPIGIQKESAIKIIKQEGFSLYELPVTAAQEKAGDERFVAIWKYGATKISHNEVRMVFDFKNKILMRSKSEIIYKSL